MIHSKNQQQPNVMVLIPLNEYFSKCKQVIEPVLPTATTSPISIMGRPMAVKQKSRTNRHETTTRQPETSRNKKDFD
jgi:hypothetical protein